MHIHTTLTPALLTLAILAAGTATVAQAAPVNPQQESNTPASSPQPPASAPHRAYHFFGALPDPAQQADSGITLGLGILHQHYVETIAGTTLDSERGSLPVYRLGYAGQWRHFGFGVSVQYAHGHDYYDGSLESCTQAGCSCAPVTSRTHNQIVDLTTALDDGFSPVQGLAVIPEVLLGEHYWHRAIDGVGPSDLGSVTENYLDLYYAGGLKLQYTSGPVVLGVEGRYGRTFFARMAADPLDGTFNLGHAPVYSVRAQVTWVALPWLKLHLRDTYGSFSYGASQLLHLGNGLTAQEPHSRTQQNLVEVGITLL